MLTFLTPTVHMILCKETLQTSATIHKCVTNVHKQFMNVRNAFFANNFRALALGSQTRTCFLHQ